MIEPIFSNRIQDQLIGTARNMDGVHDAIAEKAERFINGFADADYPFLVHVLEAMTESIKASFNNLDQLVYAMLPRMNDYQIIVAKMEEANDES